MKNIEKNSSDEFARKTVYVVHATFNHIRTFAHKLEVFGSYKEAKNYVYRTRLIMHYRAVDLVNSVKQEGISALSVYNKIQDSLPELSIIDDNYPIDYECSHRLCAINSKYFYDNFILTYGKLFEHLPEEKLNLISKFNLFLYDTIDIGYLSNYIHTILVYQTLAHAVGL